MRYRYWTGVGASLILGSVLGAAGVGKLLYQTGNLRLLSYSFPVFFPTAFARTIAILLPYAEVTVGLLLIIGIMAKLMGIFSAVLIAGFIAHNFWLLSLGLGYQPCGCLGIVGEIAQEKLLVIHALFIDVGMLGLALLILIYFQGNFFNINPWFSASGEELHW